MTSDFILQYRSCIEKIFEKLEKQLLYFQRQSTFISFNGVQRISFSYKWFLNGIPFEIQDYNLWEPYFSGKSNTLVIMSLLICNSLFFLLTDRKSESNLMLKKRELDISSL